MQTIPKEHTISTVQNLLQQGVHKESSTAKGKMICDDDLIIITIIIIIIIIFSFLFLFDNLLKITIEFRSYID